MANELDFGTGIALIKGLGGKPTDAQVTSAVDAWLDNHPEATTTVEDGSITKAKLDSNLAGAIDDVGDLKTAIDDYVVRTVEATQDDLVAGYNLNNYGAIVANANFTCTKYIDIKPSANATMYVRCTALALYNADLDFIKYVAAANPAVWEDIEVIAPANAAYIRMSGPTGTLTSPSDFHVKCAVFSNTELLNSFASKEDVSALMDAVEPVYANMIDPQKIEDGYTVNASTGKLTPTTNGWSVTGYLLLKKNTVYTFSKLYYAGFFAFYSVSDKTFVSNPDATVTRENPNDNYFGAISVGSSDLYFRGSMLTSTKSAAFVSSVYGEYKPYGVVPMKDELMNPPCRFDKVLIIGDSISAYNYGSYKKWVQALTDEGYFMADINNNSVHATGYVASLSGQQDDTFGVRLKAVTTPSAYDLVVVFGGVNDYLQNIPMGTESDEVTDGFVAAVNDFYSYLAENYLNARLLVILPMKCVTAYNSSGEPVANTAGKQLSDYTDYIKQVAEKYSIPVLDLLKASGFYPWVTAFKTAWTHNSDGLHPNADYSADFLAPLIRHFIDKY